MGSKNVRSCYQCDNWDEEINEYYNGEYFDCQSYNYCGLYDKVAKLEKENIDLRSKILQMRKLISESIGVMIDGELTIEWNLLLNDKLNEWRYDV